MALPIILPTLGGFLGLITANIVGRVLMALGVSFVTYTGLDTALDYVKGEVAGIYGQLPTLVIQVFSVLQLDTCLNISLSAIAARILVNVAGGGEVTKMLFK